MKENAIRKKFKEICEKNGWANWFPARVKFYENDIFGIADVVISDGTGLVLIQLTTLSNISARRKKIKKVLETTNLSCHIQIWGWDKKKKCFKVVYIYE